MSEDKSSSMGDKVDHRSDRPFELSHQLIKQITNGFDEALVVGRGESGTVYKGTFETGEEVAVKVFMSGFDKRFLKELDRLRRLKHQNVVELLGFCNESHNVVAEYNGMQVIAEEMHMALCFEYLHNGSLAKHMSDDGCSGLNWHIQFKIIKGICQGLEYLHNGLEFSVWHLNLKPTSILLDKNMIPRITDFGLSRLSGENTSEKINFVDASYLPPEFKEHGAIFTQEFDVYSLGLIIATLMSGHKGYFRIRYMTLQKFIKHVCDSWRKRLSETLAPKSLEVYCEQVKKCIEIAVNCKQHKREERPTIQFVVSNLVETEIMIGNLGLQTEQFFEEESILPKGGIQVTPSDKEPSCSFLSPPHTSQLIHLHKSSWSSSLAPQESVINNCPDFSCESSRAQVEEDKSSSMLDKVDHRSDQPCELSHQFIKQITKEYDEALIVGTGAFGTVYKGMFENGKEIAVKVLRNMTGIDNKEFQKEFENLRRLKHQNVVELVGFCNEAEKLLVEHDGNQVVADKMHTALCFEYVCNGSLAKHISADGCSGLDWHIQYKIIKGICQGLQYLRHGLGFAVWHLDLKPANILLDSNMIPKIADFGLSRLLGDENTRKTITVVGTGGYLPPEYIEHGLITKEYDIFSLGVIIAKLMAGREGYFKIDDMGEKRFIKHVHDNWRKRLRQTLAPRPLELYCEQVKMCIRIAVKCMNRKRQERPTIEFIVSNLVETEIMIGNLGLQTDQFRDGEPDLPKGGIHASRTPGMATDASKAKTGDGNAGTASTEWKELPLELLQKITNDFSDERVIGRGAFGTLYKGILEDGEVIMVKKLAESMPMARHRVFVNEVQCLTALKHENAAHMVGFCRETYKKVVLHDGRYTTADTVESLLCYEYLSKGSLQQNLFEVPSKMGWETRFKIIKGICQGLLFLHSIPIVHMDIKPENILLDNNMRPKIADFGLSRLFDQEETRMNTHIVVGSYGYMAPEYLYRGEISTKSDIYSLGLLILETSTGETDIFNSNQPSARNFIDNVHEKWTPEHIAREHSFLDSDGLRQVKTCIEIGLECVQIDRHKRPSIKQIVNKLDGLSQIGSDSLLSLQPQRINFPIKPKRLTSSSLYLINMTDNCIAFRIVTKIPKKYRTKLPFYGIVLPKCTCTLNVITPEQKKGPPSDNDDSLTLQSSIALHEDLDNVDPASVAAFLATAGDEVQETKVVVDCEPLADTVSNQIIDGQNYREVLSVDVHPTEPWVLTSNQKGYVCIWNYQTQEEMDSIEITREPAYSAKFIEREEWFVVGGGDGYIYVYNYNTMEEAVDMIEAHDSSIVCLAVNPTHSFVLSASDDHTIKLWDWSSEWQCTQTFEGHEDTVTQVIFDPRNSESFASASLDRTVKFWNIHSATCNFTWDGHQEGLLCVHYHPHYFKQFLVSGSSDGAAKVWDLETDSCVDTLQEHAKDLTALCWHPELRVLVTGSLDGTVRIWNWKSTSCTYRLENILALNLGAVHALGYLKGLTRIVVGCDQGIALMDINVV